MITAEQIKAARALLKWKQSTLAGEANISLPSINNVERGIGSARVDTMQAIQSALENAGIEFISDTGVTLRKEIFDIHKYEGTDFIEKLNDDLFSCMKSAEDEVVMCSINEKMFPKHVPNEMMRYYHYQKETQFSEKILIRDDDKFLLASPHTYRWVSPNLIGTIPYYVYKDRFAMIMWDSKRVVIIRNQSIADTFRKQFDFLWELGTKLPKSLSSKLEDKEFIKKLKDK